MNVSYSSGSVLPAVLFTDGGYTVIGRVSLGVRNEGSIAF
jgi:hypothetical protein